MSYQYNCNYNASSANGGLPMRGGQGNGMAPAMHGHSVQHSAIHQQQPAVYQRAQAPLQQAPAPQPSLPPARAPPPPPPIHFVLDRQYTLCRAPSPPAQPAPPTQYVPVPGLVPHYTPSHDVPHYTPTRDVPHYVPRRDGAHYTPARDGAHYTLPRDVPHHTPARYVPPALRNGPQYTPAPTPYAPAALVPFRCAHPQCGGRVVMVPSAREHMWAAHRVRV